MTLPGYVYVALLVGISVFLSIRNPWRALLWSFALLPWFGLDMDIGLRITAFQLFVLPLVASYILRGLPGLVPLGRMALPLVWFLTYAVLVSLAILPFLPEPEIAGGALRSPTGRAVTQLIMLFFTVAPLFVAARLCRHPDSLIELAGAYVKSCLVLAAVGYLQISIWYRTGENPFPIGFFDTLVTGGQEQYRSGLFGFDGLNVYRMNSFGGEPKNLGQALVVALLLLVWGYSAGIAALARRFMAKALVLLVAIFLTQSTSAFVLLAVGLAVVIMTGATGWASRQRLVGLLVIGVTVAVLGALLVGIWLDLPVATLISMRTVGRAGESELGWLEDFDAAIVAYLAEHWTALIFGAGIGNIHLFADPYLLPEVAIFAGGTSFVAKMGFLRVVSETGVIGALLMLLFLLVLWRGAHNVVGQTARPAIVIAVLAYFLVGHASLFYVFAGAAIGTLRMRQIYSPRLSS